MSDYFENIILHWLQLFHYYDYDFLLFNFLPMLNGYQAAVYLQWIKVVILSVQGCYLDSLHQPSPETGLLIRA